MTASPTNSTAIIIPMPTNHHHGAATAYKSASKDSPESLELLCNFWREEGPTPLDGIGDTLLHFLAIYGNVTAVKKLRTHGLLTAEGLRAKNKRGDTALHEAARLGQKGVSGVLLEVDEGLAAVQNKWGETPLYLAAAYGKKEAFVFLEMVSDCMTRRNDGCTILHAAIMGECYSLALRIVKTYPDLAQIYDGKGVTALHLLAAKPSSFRSSSKYVLKNLGMTTFIPSQLVGALIYFCTPLMYDEPEPNEKVGIRKALMSSLTKFFSGIPWLQDIIAEKQKHTVTLTLAKRLIEEERDWRRYRHISNPLIEAIKHGVNELAMEIIEKHPDAENSLDQNGRNLLHLAAEHKHRLLYNNLKKLIHKDRMLVEVDKQKNTILHLAANLGSVPQLPPGVTNQMTWDVFWFKNMENDINPYVIHLCNSDGKTAEELFEEKHKCMRKKAEKVEKEMNEGLMLVSAFIATVNVAALFTVPGGFNKQGRPVLLNDEYYKKNMKLLIGSTGLTLFASFFALASQLSIQLSRFHSNDFYIALPLKYVLAATSLFYSSVFSLTTCMLAFILEETLNLFPVVLASIMMILIYIDVAYLPFSYTSLALYHSFTRSCKKV